MQQPDGALWRSGALALWHSGTLALWRFAGACGRYTMEGRSRKDTALSGRIPRWFTTWSGVCAALGASLTDPIFNRETRT